MPAYRCRNWTFQPDNQALVFDDGRTEQLPSRLSACLLTLVSGAGKTVSYDELLQKVWGTTHKDASTISSVISEVRKLVGCGQNGEKLIVTISKRGYCFKGDVEVIDDAVEPSPVKSADSASSTTQSAEVTEANTSPAAESDTLIPQPQKDRPPKHKGLLLVVALVVIALFVTLISTIDFGSEAPTAQVFKDYEVLTHEMGRESEFDVSTDGRWLVYVNKVPHVASSLIVKEISTGNTQSIAASGDYYFGSPVFSDDGKQLVFHKQTEAQCEVWLADFSNFRLNASQNRKLTDCGKGGFWSTTAFSKDGEHIYFSRAKALTDPYKVYRLDLRTGFERSITSPTSSGRGDYGFSLSPDGSRLAVVRNVLWQESHIILSNTADNHSEEVLELPYLIARVGWLSDSQLVYCDKNDTVWAYDIGNKQTSVLAQVDFSCGYPVVANGQLYGIKKIRVNNAIWSLNKNQQGQFAIQPLIDSPYYDFNAMFGPDNTLYFMSDRSGEQKLWQQTEQGFVQHKSVKLPANARELEYSIDTNSLYGLAEKRLFRYDLELDKIEWLSKEKHEVFNFSMSDDGQLIFSEGKDEYWSLKSFDLLTLKMTDLGINGFSARQANGLLYFSRFHENGLWRKNLQTGETTKLFEDLNIKFNTFWEIWQSEQLIWATDNKFKIFDLNSGELLSDNLSYQGHVGFLKCSNQRKMCTFSFRENDESEVVQFK